MSWYTNSGNVSDIIMSSRCRFARNIEKTPIGNRLTDEKMREIIDHANSALSPDFTRIDFDRLDPLTASAFVEEHIVSTDFARSSTPHTLFKNDKDGIYIMVGEEDHFRIQSIIRGDAIEEAYKNAKNAESVIAAKFPLAFDEKLGYLTHCPTNLGTAMRVSYMMFLPALTEFGGISALSESLPKLGFTIRGMYGEGSGGVGCIYQISNSITMGQTETETVEALRRVAKSVAEEEKRLRKKLYENAPDEVTDKISRAYGTLTHAHLMSRREFLKLWIDVRLGISLYELTGTDVGIPDTLTYEKLDSLLIEAQPSVLTLSHGGSELTPRERDKFRAQLAGDRLRS